MAAAYVQGAANGATTGTTLQVTPASDVTAGNQLVLHARINSGSDASVADSLGNTWTVPELYAGNAGAGEETIQVFRCKNIATGGSCTITVTFPSSGRHGVVVKEFSGVDTSAAFDDSAASTQYASADTSVEMGTIDTTAAGYVYSGVVTQSGAVITSGDTGYGNILTNSTGRISGLHRITTGALTSHAAVHTLGSAQFWSAAQVAVAEASAGGFTLTAEAGSFAVTGTAAGLLHGRQVAAEAGSYAVTGTAAALLRGFPLTAEAGSFSVTGAAAGLQKTWLLDAQAGAYTASGQDASLELGRRLDAEAGAYVVTGQDATLTYTPAGAYTLAAEAGSIAITGADAALLHARRISAEAATFDVTGADAGLLLGRSLVAAGGSFALNGLDAGLFIARKLFAEPGAYTVNGQPATLAWSGAGVTPIYGWGARGRIGGAGRDPWSRIGSELAKDAGKRIGSEVAGDASGRIGSEDA